MKKLLWFLLFSSSLLAQVNVQKDANKKLSNGSIVVGDGTSITASGNGVIAATSIPGLVINTDSPITGGGSLASNLTLSMPVANGSTNGYLSSADWTTFNAKAPTGNYLTALTGDGTATGPGSAVFTLSNVNSNVGTFAGITVNAKGRVTAATALTTLAQYGIIDGINFVNNDVNVLGLVVGHGMTIAWTGTLSAARLNANVVQAVTNDTNITGSISTQNLTLGWTGTLAANRLNANVVQAVTNDTNVTGSVGAQSLTLGWTGQLSVARGGTGANTLTGVVLGNGTSAFTTATLSNLTLSTGTLGISATYPGQGSIVTVGTLTSGAIGSGFTPIANSALANSTVTIGTTAIALGGSSSTLSGVTSITGGAGNMTITSGTGNSRTMALQTTTSGGVATTFFTGGADQSATANSTIDAAASGTSYSLGSMGGIYAAKKIISSSLTIDGPNSSISAANFITSAGSTPLTLTGNNGASLTLGAGGNGMGVFSSDVVINSTNGALAPERSTSLRLKAPSAVTFGPQATIVGMGDSIPHGYPGGIGYEPALADSIGATTWFVMNKGVDGDNTTQMLARFTTDVLNQPNVKYVIIMGGVNDLIIFTPPATVQSNLQAMYTAAHNAGLKVIAMTISPWANSVNWGPSLQTDTVTVNTWITSTAINVDYVVNAYSFLGGGGTSLLPQYDSGDHIHLSNAGYYALGNYIASQVGTWTVGSLSSAAQVSMTTGAFQQSPAALASMNGYLATNFASAASTTLLNPGVVVFNDGSSSVYGMDLGYASGAYRTRFISASGYFSWAYNNSGGAPSSQSHFTEIATMNQGTFAWIPNTDASSTSVGAVTIGGAIALGGGNIQLTGRVTTGSVLAAGNLYLTAASNGIPAITWGGNTPGTNPVITSDGSYVTISSKAGANPVYINFDNTNAAATVNLFAGKAIFTQPGALTLTTTLTTGAPSAGIAQPWKLGNVVTGSGLAVSTTSGVRVNINGTDYTLAVLTTNP